MLTSFRWLALEVKYLDRARSFYVDHLGLPVRSETDEEVVFDAGGPELRLRRPSGVPRGGVHTHYAFSTGEGYYDDWWDRLSASFDLDEHRFGSARSLYFYDPDGHCVEIGEAGGEDPIAGIFEVVFEVEDLAAATDFYLDLGFEMLDEGGDRPRVRLGGPVDLELWEPQLGIADARGGLHVDVGFGADDPAAVVDAVRDRACAVESIEDGVRIRDPDGHRVTVLVEGTR